MTDGDRTAATAAGAANGTARRRGRRATQTAPNGTGDGDRDSTKANEDGPDGGIDDVVEIDRVTSRLRHSPIRRRKMSGMPRRARVVTWNGKDVPPELRELPAGRYVVEAVEEEAPALSPEEEAGIEAALESYRQGRVVDAKRAREIIDAALGR